MAKDRDMSAGGAGRCILRQRGQIATVPSITKDARQYASLAPHHTERPRKFRLQDIKPLIGDTRVCNDLAPLSVGPLALALQFPDFVPHRPNHALPGTEPAVYSVGDP